MMTGLNQVETLAEMFAGTDKLYEHLATIYWKMFKSLTANDKFTEEQAIEILKSIPIFGRS
jgi:hypothetical protein